MRKDFPIFQSHIDLAHSYWAKAIQKGDIVIDATCGNGHDTYALCQLALSNDKGKVYAIDIQQEAILSTRDYLQTHLSEITMHQIEFHQRCHSTFPQAINPNSVKLIVYNLGYLPGGDKSLTTQFDSTLNSVANAQQLLVPGGIISITCYPGHENGYKEQQALLKHLSTLSPQQWSCCHHWWLNRNKAPSLLIIQRSLHE